METEPFAAAAADAARLAQRTGVAEHHVAVVLGSGWAPAAAALGAPDAVVPYDDLPGFPEPSVAGHAGTVSSVAVGGTRVAVLAGRAHLYEGLAPQRVVHAVRVAVLSGCRVVILTNASGSLRAELPVGRPVLIADHLNLMGANPLTGPEPPPPHGSRFCDLTEGYSARLRSVARDVDPALREGVYAGVAGPSYETPAEIRMLRTLGADLVGMSTVFETIAARHLGAEVLGISLVTNQAAGLGERPLSHGDVLAAGEAAGTGVESLLRQVVERL